MSAEEAGPARPTGLAREAPPGAAQGSDDKTRAREATDDPLSQRGD